MNVFGKGEYVVAGNKGVCLVEDVTTLNITGVDKEREYYILKPIYLSGSTVYMPVDTAANTMRRVLTREEADGLIHAIPQIPILDTTNDKLLEQEYRDCVRTNNCQELIRIIKTIYQRRQKRLEAGRKETAVDAKYFRIAEDSLYGELSIALNIPRKDVADYITGHIDN